MDNHSLKILEFQQVLAKLASHTSTTQGREASMQLAPATYPDIIKKRLQETREARRLLDEDSGMPLGGLFDIRDIVARAAIGHILTPSELISTAHTIQSAKRLKQYLQKRAISYPLLADIAGNITLPTHLDTIIESAISSGGEIMDSASPELSRIRQKLRNVHSRLMDRLNGMLSSEKYRSYIQEPIITLREGRYCIPVKSENRSHLNGIVHDASSSGATVFIEPAGCVDMGNELKELSIREEQEMARILAHLSSLTEASSSDLQAMSSLVANLDMANAKALLSIEMQAIEPELNRNGEVLLLDARHPLLKGDVVPITLDIGKSYSVLLLTGPNTGGKTVALKTLGLLTLMAQSGLFIPADAKSRLAIFDSVFADIGDEQDIQQSLSTFSAHMGNIVRILTTMRGMSLILLDEPGAGTDPAEGAALARAILEVFLERNARIIATTHYGELKEYACAYPGVENAAVEFDKETLAPTYRILLGVPGCSHALYIAEKLGLPSEIIQKARGFISSRDKDSAEILQQIEESRRIARDAEILIRRQQVESEKLLDEYRRKVREIEETRKTVQAQAMAETRAIFEKAKRDIADMIADIKSSKEDSSLVAPIEMLKDLREDIFGSLQSAPEIIEDIPMEPDTLRKGDRVEILSLHLEGEVLDDPTGDSVSVKVGAMRASMRLTDLRKLPPIKKLERAEELQAPSHSLQVTLNIAPEINLRGMRVEEAQIELTKYIDEAITAGLSEARIIHGKGSGILRKYVQEFLREHTGVISYRNGNANEGGDGVTVVQFG
jgi:DNA mismatch repair protein MutS2